MKRHSTFGLLALIAAFTVTLPTSADPLFSIGEGGEMSWEQAMDAGRVMPATDGLTNSAIAFYESQINADPSSYQMVVPQLTPDLDVMDMPFGETHQSLVMSWPFPQPGVLHVAAWDYVYDVDPDLSNAMIHFSVFAPTGVWDLSLELIDSSGRSKGWFQAMPPAIWTNRWVNAAGGPQAPFSFFHEQDGFDITQVVTIRLNESGAAVIFPVPPPGAPPGQWNAWNHLTVTEVPEPSTYLLFGLGALGVLVWKRRRKIAG